MLAFILVFTATWVFVDGIFYFFVPAALRSPINTFVLLDKWWKRNAK